MTGFWSARKAAVAAEAQAEVRAAEAEAQAARDREIEQRSDEDLLDELGLPDPDTLGSGDDIRAFLAEHVPARLRNRALRSLWRSNPVLANLDGLNDYDGDFTDAGGSGIVQTTYRVGKGLARHVETLMEDEKAGEQPVLVAEAEDNSPQESVTTDAPAVAPVKVEVTHDPSPDSPASPPRRMRFSFEEDAA
ncbi:DUF3306 domain-containing protein [Pseudoruegeria sp. HB172150]|uniref:DUF3306 domain-containing protein n=1 Tax=Pseudoruegeria sp. HB172150 TaxID=2721164 RepID=UPI0015579366|nr:DUF3306 domain-containing protein [Pseudoruegeria sp. HB172150]